MSNLPTTSLEKTSLEAHVDLCAMRYQQLDTRLNILEQKVDHLAVEISNSNSSLKTTMVTTSGTIIVGIIGLIATLLMK